MGRILKRAALGLAGVLALLLLAGLVLLAWPVPDPLAPRRAAGPLAVTGVTVIDPASEALLPDQTVVLAEGRIARIGPAGSFDVPPSAAVIDGRGKFLIPGLWDLHVHLASKLAPQLTMPLFVAHGVTGILEMGAFVGLEQKRSWQDQIRAGELLGPRLLGQAAFIVSSVADGDEARELVRRVDPARGEFVKVLDDIPPESYATLLEAARAEGVAVLGHRPRAVSALRAAAAGQGSFEHARLFLFECFPGAEDLRARYRAAYAGEEIPGRPLRGTDLRRSMVDEHDSALCREIFDAMVEHGVWFCPTHVTRKMDARADDPAFRSDPRLAYIHPGQRLWWQFDADGMVDADPSPAGRKSFEDFYQAGLALTGDAHRAGVRVVAGTDANDTYCFPGFSLHDELRELVRAGLTPMEALRAATLHPAEALGLEAEHGSIEPGKVADLLLLDADPLEEISNTARIDTVLLGGAAYPRDELDRMLASVRRNARSWSLVMKAGWEKTFFDELRSAAEILESAP